MSFLSEVTAKYQIKELITDVLADLNEPHSREFVKKFENKFLKYKDWYFDYMLGDQYRYYKNGGDLNLFFTPDHKEDGYLAIQMQDEDLNPINDFKKIYKLNLPSDNNIKYQSPLTPEKLFSYVKPLLDQLAKEM